jgi:hypothetical protein
MIEEIKPTADLPFEEALRELTGFEIIGIQLHYKEELEKLGGMKSLMGAVWAYENRIVKVPWPVIEAMTLNQLAGYFPDKNPDPESEQANLVEPDEEEPSG